MTPPPTTLLAQAPLLRVRRGLGVAFVHRPAPLANRVASGPKSVPVARALALAHRLQRALDRGEETSFGTLARRLGVTKARLSMLLALLALAPDLQEEVLFLGARGKADWVPLKTALEVARLPLWSQQRERWEVLTSGRGFR